MRTSFTFAALVAALSIGCVKSDSIKQQAAFEVEPLDACVAIVVDMSGSFSDSWGDRAYRVFLEISEQFFTESLGGNSRLVLAQMSNNNDFLLWEGHPSELRSRFPSPEAFNQFLKERSDPQGSPVYDATKEAVSYVSTMHGVESQTRLLTVMLSDMIDYRADTAEQKTSGYQMLEALKTYQEQGGGLALYFVDHRETSRWQRILDKAGFESGQYVIQSSLVDRPTLPRLD